jgi:hypothetical protein
MGSFLTNVQVHTGGAELEGVREAIVRALEELVPKEGYRVCSAGETADREITIASASKAPWIAVYDQASEDQGGSHEELARALSKVLTTSAVSVLVHDSDVLDMKLFRNGRALDDYCNWPGYFEGGDREPQGDERAWQPVLRSGAGPADLKEAWMAGSAGAEETLQEIAHVLAMDGDLVSVGFNYLDDIRLPEERMTTLAFRLQSRPAHEQRREGPPRLAPGMPGVPPPEEAAEIFSELGREIPPEQVFGAAPEEPFTIPVLVHNQGGGGTGLDVTIGGPALELGLVDIARVEVFSGGTRAEQLPELLTAGDRHLARATFESLPLRPGPRDPLSAMEGVTSLRQMMGRNDHVLSIQVHCVARLKPDRPVPLGVSVNPLGSVERGCLQKFLVGAGVPR